MRSAIGPKAGDDKVEDGEREPMVIAEDGRALRLGVRAGRPKMEVGCLELVEPGVLVPL